MTENPRTFFHFWLKNRPELSFIFASSSQKTLNKNYIDNYLNHHEEPEEIELYFCGPPLMNQAVQKMGEDFGIPDENIRFDDFGG